MNIESTHSTPATNSTPFTPDFSKLSKTKTRTFSFATDTGPEQLYIGLTLNCYYDFDREESKWGTYSTVYMYVIDPNLQEVYEGREEDKEKYEVLITEAFPSWEEASMVFDNMKVFVSSRVDAIYRYKDTFDYGFYYFKDLTIKDFFTKKEGEF